MSKKNAYQKVEKFDRRSLGFTIRVDEIHERRLDGGLNITLYRFADDRWQAGTNIGGLSFIGGIWCKGAKDARSAAKIAEKHIKRRLRVDVRIAKTRLKIITKLLA